MLGALAWRLAEGGVHSGRFRPFGHPWWLEGSRDALAEFYCTEPGSRLLAEREVRWNDLRRLAFQNGVVGVRLKDRNTRPYRCARF